MALLVLEDGRTFTGESYGAEGETFGEAVFNTGMTGYQETLTDPSYHRQVVVMTAPHIGNTGVNDEDPESSRIWVAGYVVRDPARVPSSWRSVRSLDDELKAHGVVGISGIDTRALTRHLRERGAMRVGISSTETDAGALLERVRGSAEMAGAELSERGVDRRDLRRARATGEKRLTVAALDLGIKTMTPYRMAERGIEVHVLPATATYDDVRATGADGLFYSNGPGDPAATTEPGRARCRRRWPTGCPTSGSASATSCSAARSGSAPTSSSTATAASTSRSWTARPARSRSPRTTTGSRSTRPLDAPTETAYGVATVSHVCLNDDVVEGLELRSAEGDLKAF